ncbi:MAG: acyltransferase family protein [Chloroflexi bacterium]|jgi:hypothetical protein|nr:acyltransferase family protein [Chloroflexota bacterium]
MSLDNPNIVRTKRVQPKRRRDLELMGALVVLGLIFFHSARIFDEGDFYVKNLPPSYIVTTVLSFAVTWAMPLMFLMAGMAIWYSLRKRTAGQFVNERFRRLFIPLFFGVLVLIPPQVYIGLHQDPAYSESYWEFLPRFFDVEMSLARFPFIISPAPETMLFEYGQLWFLVVLFGFSLVLIPLFVYLRRPAGRYIVEQSANFFARPWFVFLLAIPLAAIQITLGAKVEVAVWNPYAYALFIVYGFLIAADSRFGRSFQKNWKAAIMLGSLCFLSYMGFYLYVILSEVQGADPFRDFDLASLGFRFFFALCGWFWIVAILGLAGRLTQPHAGTSQRTPSGVGDDKPGEKESQVFEESRKTSRLQRFMRYASKAQMPIYVLHQTIIVIIGFFVVRWQVIWPAKYLVISFSTLVVTLVIYDVAVRRTRATRFLFGLKPKKKEQTVVRAPGTS